MGAQNMPAAEVEVTVPLVRALLTEQHPDLADLPVVEVANGWDNVMYRLGDALAVRVPRRQVAAALVEHEQQVLPVLAPRLPLAVPAPVRHGEPSDGLGYPWSWSVIPWFGGRVAARRLITDPLREARRLGAFMAALHVEAPAHAPPNPHRGHFIGEKTELVTGRVDDLRGSDVIDAARAVARWSELVDGVARWSGPAVWIHGDVHLANLLVDGRDDAPDANELTAVIDWGDVCAGDPATDLAVAWSLFDADARRVFRDAAGARRAIDDDTWRRAEAWALHFGIVYVLHSADNPTMSAIGRELLAALDVAVRT